MKRLAAIPNRALLPSDQVLLVPDVGTKKTGLSVYAKDRSGRLKSGPDGELAIGRCSFDDLAGEEVGESLQISPRAVARITRSLKAAATFSGLLGAEVIAVGTWPFRTAVNATEVIKHLKRRSGIVMRPLSGCQEAVLGAEAVFAAVRGGEWAVTFTSGGGSTQWAAGNRKRIADVGCIEFGILQLRKFWEDHGHLGANERLRRTRDYAVGQLIPHVRDLREGFPVGGVAYVGSGTADSLLAKIEREGDRPVTSQEVTHLTEWVTSLTPDEREKRFPERDEFVVPGAILLEAMTHAVGIQQLRPARGRLSDGIAQRWVKGLLTPNDGWDQLGVTGGQRREPPALS